MIKKPVFRHIVAAVLALGFVFALALPAAAAEDTPQAVLDARSGVVRIIVFEQYGQEVEVYTGSGFAVGEDDDIHIVTNAHVAGADEVIGIYVFYDTGRSVMAQAVHIDHSRDLAILKPEKKIPHLQPLNLETGAVNNGAAVYALGFPAAADLFTSFGNNYYDTYEEFLLSVVADEPSMSITNGIISAVHNSVLVGDMSREVEVIQTNTAINGGNSGGPLVNREGRVVGVNTFGITVADAMNGCVHVNELIGVLKKQRISYTGTPEEQITAPASTASGEDGPNLVLIGIIAFFALVVIGGVIAVILAVRRQKKGGAGQLTLEAFEQRATAVSEPDAYEMARSLVAELVPLAGYDLRPLLRPDNIIIEDKTMRLREKSATPGVNVPIYPGYTAPEQYDGAGGPAAWVYFVGAVTYTLLCGRRPPEALGRRQRNALAFGQQATALKQLVNNAMEPQLSARVPNLYALQQQLGQVGGTVYAQAGQYWPR